MSKRTERQAIANLVRWQHGRGKPEVLLCRIPSYMDKFVGYMHPRYAYSLHEFGEPRRLPSCGGWILVRPIPGTPYKDAMGCYPLFLCRDWTRLHEDLEHIGPDVVSLALVTDTFSGVTPVYLEQYFDVIKPFKVHYLVDLSHPLESFVYRNHRRNSRHSLGIMDVEVCYEPAQYLDDWIRLYDNLIIRHDIKGISAFSPKCFQIQLNIPGMVMFLGRRKREIIGATLVFIHDQVAYNHLAAYSSEGYKIKASYGILWMILKYLKERQVRFFDLGASAGIVENAQDGLTCFKAGWSNESRTVYFCGRVLENRKYTAICQHKNIGITGYFPAYREGEF